MAVVQTVATASHPIGITYDAAPTRVWVACSSQTSISPPHESPTSHASLSATPDVDEARSPPPKSSAARTATFRCQGWVSFYMMRAWDRGMAIADALGLCTARHSRPRRRATTSRRGARRILFRPVTASRMWKPHTASRTSISSGCCCTLRAGREVCGYCRSPDRMAITRLRPRVAPFRARATT